MLDFNKRPSMGERINAAVDAALKAESAATPPRDYLGASRLGHACERALQFEFAGAPKDEGQDFSGRSLRIFAIGHELEDLAIRWLRAAGLDLVTQKRDGGQFGFSVAGGRIRGHVDVYGSHLTLPTGGLPHYRPEVCLLQVYPPLRPLSALRARPLATWAIDRVTGRC